MGLSTSRKKVKRKNIVNNTMYLLVIKGSTILSTLSLLKVLLKKEVFHVTELMCIFMQDWWMLPMHPSLTCTRSLRQEKGIGVSEGLFWSIIISHLRVIVILGCNVLAISVFLEMTNYVVTTDQKYHLYLYTCYV